MIKILGIALHDAQDNEPVRVQIFETDIDTHYNFIKRLFVSRKNSMTFIAGNEIKKGDPVMIDFDKIKVYKYVRSINN